MACVIVLGIRKRKSTMISLKFKIVTLITGGITSSNQSRDANTKHGHRSHRSDVRCYDDDPLELRLGLVAVGRPGVLNNNKKKMLVNCQHFPLLYKIFENRPSELDSFV